MKKGYLSNGYSLYMINEKKQVVKHAILIEFGDIVWVINVIIVTKFLIQKKNYMTI